VHHPFPPGHFSRRRGPTYKGPSVGAYGRAKDKALAVL
jgi:hypothetical protein